MYDKIKKELKRVLGSTESYYKAKKIVKEILAAKKSDKSDLMSEEEFIDSAPFATKEMYKYLQKAEKLVKSGKAKSVEDIEDKLGYGVVDKAILKDTFFAEATVTASLAFNKQQLKELEEQVERVKKRGDTKDKDVLLDWFSDGDPYERIIDLGDDEWSKSEDAAFDLIEKEFLKRVL
jgi:hypothetical protein